MLEIVTTSGFNRDVRLAQRRGKDLAKLQTVIDLLAAEAPLPQACRDHALSGNFAGFRDCRIEGGWILIYRKLSGTLQLILARTGTHSDIFK